MLIKPRGKPVRGRIKIVVCMYYKGFSMLNKVILDVGQGCE